MVEEVVVEVVGRGDQGSKLENAEIIITLIQASLCTENLYTDDTPLLSLLFCSGFNCIFSHQDRELLLSTLRRTG